MARTTPSTAMQLKGSPEVLIAAAEAVDRFNTRRNTAEIVRVNTENNLVAGTTVIAFAKNFRDVLNPDSYSSVQIEKGEGALSRLIGLVATASQEDVSDDPFAVPEDPELKIKKTATANLASYGFDSLNEMEDFLEIAATNNTGFSVEQLLSLMQNGIKAREIETFIEIWNEARFHSGDDEESAASLKVILKNDRPLLEKIIKKFRSHGVRLTSDIDVEFGASIIREYLSRL